MTTQPILVVFGTRPEAVKMAPVIRALEEDGSFRVIRLATAQHREMLDDVLRVFGIAPDYDLDVMTDDQTLAEVTARCVTGIDRILRRERPAMTLAQGDTTTVMAAALASYYNRTPFGHVEAGLRTEDRFSPFPEEVNRRVADVLADLHFAPTAGAARNLRAEGIGSASVHVCGNTVVDAVLRIAACDSPETRLPAPIEGFLRSVERPVLVTAHRRESFGRPLENICRALLDIVEADRSAGLVFPVHPNPKVRATVGGLLAGRERIHCCSPVDYLRFVHLMKRSYLILTDSGGVQEEAPSLGKPVLVLREKTERPEGIEAGVARLVGTDRGRIVEEALRLLGSEEERERMVGAGNPYGDGRAGPRIVTLVRSYLEQKV
jgi:UDP-N-acetylglucosamine 2-epimerase (non-hydrolysing)